MSRSTVPCSPHHPSKPDPAGSTGAPAGSGYHQHLVLFLSRATPLRIWHEAGIIEREAALYRRMRPLLGSIRIVTSGGPEELAYQDYLGDVELLYNRWRLPPNLYSLAAPLLHRRKLMQATVYKTNQLDGAWTAIIAGRLYRKPVVVRAGYLWTTYFDRFAPGTWRAALARRLQNASLRQASAIVLTTEEMHRQVLAQVGPLTAPVEIIPNYVDTELFRPRPEIAQIPGRLCYIGRLEPEKNLSILLDALAQLPGASLTIIGDGSQRAQLAEQARTQGVSVQFKGIVPNHQLPEEIAQAQVFVLPSQYEGHPKALVEAMACGAAVVGSDVQGIRSVIRHEETGLLCPPETQALSATLRRLLADAGLRARLGKAARVYAETHYGLAAIVQTELTLLQRLTNQSPMRKPA